MVAKNLKYSSSDQTPYLFANASNKSLIYLSEISKFYSVLASNIYWANSLFYKTLSLFASKFNSTSSHGFAEPSFLAIYITRPEAAAILSYITTPIAVSHPHHARHSIIPNLAPTQHPPHAMTQQHFFLRSVLSGSSSSFSILVL